MRSVLAMAVVLLLTACTDPTDTTLHVTGMVRHNGDVVVGGRVNLIDSRGNYAPVVQLGTTTTNADGSFTVEGKSARDGYACGGERTLALSVEGYEYSTMPSAGIRCTSSTQHVDLDLVDNLLTGP